MAPQRTSSAAFGPARAFDLRAAAAAMLGLLPSGRSVAGGFAVLALALAGYAGARTTSVFAVEQIEVAGLSGADAVAARRALAPLQGRSLVVLRRGDLERRLAPLPGISSFEYDRAFPHTLVVRAVPEIPLAVVRRGGESWLVSRRGRVLRTIPTRTRLDLPRVWISRRVALGVGTTLADDAGGAAVRALALLEATRAGVRARTVRMGGELTYVLRSGVELRLGSSRAIALKLAVAAEILPALAPEFRYLDVSVPTRPVAGTESQVEG